MVVEKAQPLLEIHDNIVCFPAKDPGGQPASSLKPITDKVPSDVGTRDQDYAFATSTNLRWRRLCQDSWWTERSISPLGLGSYLTAVGGILGAKACTNDSRNDSMRSEFPSIMPKDRTTELLIGLVS